MSRHSPQHRSNITTCRAVVIGTCPNPEECRFAYGIWDGHLTGTVLNDRELMSHYYDCSVRGNWVTKAQMIDVEVLEHIKRQRELIENMRGEWGSTAFPTPGGEVDDDEDDDEIEPVQRGIARARNSITQPGSSTPSSWRVYDDTSTTGNTY